MQTVILYSLNLVILIAIGLVLFANGQTDDEKQFDQVNAKVASFFEAGNFEKASKAAEEALAIAGRLYGEQSKQAAAANVNLAIILRERKKYKESVSHFEKAIEINEKISDIGVQERVSVIEVLADVQIIWGKLRDAEVNLKNALEIRKKGFGENSKEGLKGLLNLASFFSRTGKFRQADELYLEGLRIASVNLGNGNQEIDLVDETRGCTTSVASIRREDNLAYHKARDSILMNHSDAPVFLDGKAKNLPRPEYPEEAKLQRIGGIVFVRVKVDEAGKVSEANAVCGPSVLREAAERSAINASFSPILKNGVAVKVNGMITFSFVAP